ncbi:CHASE [Shewanella denitrificans OS217]|uniref:Sensory/regulatory protein RpfC n=1 Tax=Shewanella denitrificans (strain OS217 / ATCC BAA-1090 / DSM 15013) TaxID=318161 RepID=Q12NK9_SHEDO|nr:PAS domain S-box protein [Shewanella denitrificans]ABE54967.1 CHASE [Shewanella denitrificans OS217]
MTQHSSFKQALLFGGLVFTLGLAISLATSLWVHDKNQRFITQALEENTQDISQRVIERVTLYQYGLRSARGSILTAGEQGISREIFKGYSDTRDIDIEFPGARGFGFIRRVKPIDEASFIAKVKHAGWPDFSIRQLTPHDNERFVIELVEPVERNMAAIGLDIASETNRYQAAYQALLSGKVHLSGPITLVQATGNPQQSFLILLPIYRTGNIPETVKLRKAEGFGWSYAPLVIDEVLEDLNLTQETTKLELKDVTDNSNPVLFYQTHAFDTAKLSRYSTTLSTNIFGRQWTISVSAYPVFIESLHLTRPSLVLAYGLLMSLLFAVLMAFYSRNKQQKRLLDAENARRANILEHSLDAIISYDSEGLITGWNQGAEHIFGYTKDEVMQGANLGLIVPAANKEIEWTQFKQVLSGEAIQNAVGVHHDKEQNKLSTSMTALPIYNHVGVIVGVSQTIRDITAAQDAERQIHELNASLERKVHLRTQALEHVVAENKTLFDTIDQQLLYSEIDLQGIILAVNDNFCEASGYSREQLVGLSHLQVSSGEHDKLFWQRLWNKIKSGKPWHGEICTLDSKGEPKWFDTVIAPIFDKQKNIERFVSLATDITERKNAQLEKNKVGALLSNVLFAASEVAIIATDETGIISIFNRGAERLLGYHRDELVGKISPAIFHLTQEVMLRGDELSAEHGIEIRGFEAFIYHAKHKGPETRRWTYVRKDGSECQVSLSVSAMRDTQGNLLGYLGVATNIDLMLKQQEELVSTSTQLTQAAEVAELGIWTWEIETNILDWNERMFAIYDYPSSLNHNGLSYQHWLDRLHPDDVDMAQEKLKAAIEGTGEYDPIFRVIRPSDEVRYVQGGAHVIRDRFGKALKLLGINRDITEQRELEHTLRRAKEEADATSAAKSAFLANMSHEIRTPMNAILGMLQLVQHTDMTPQQQDYVSKTEVAAQSLLGLLNDILDFSKIDAGKLNVDLHPCSLEEIMRELAVLLAANMRRKHIEVLFDLDPSIPELVLADKQRLQQVLLNLAGNAIKFTAQGHVILQVFNLKLSSHKVRLRISVADTGIGINVSQLDKIFQGFMQAESSTSRRFGGTGLGLAITKRLVELMGAELEVESQEGQGSRFWFDIEFELVETPITKSTLTLNNRRVLLVDDSAMSRKIVANTLVTHGAEVVEASGGLEALTLIEQSLEEEKAFDAVVMDWRMPELNGLEAAERIHELCGHKPRPAVIMLTAYAEDLMLESKAYSSLPFVSLLTKPTTANLILETLDNAIMGKVERGSTKKWAQDNLQGLSILVVEDNALNRQVIDELLKLQGAIVTLAEGGIEGVKQVTDQGMDFDIVIMDMQMPDIDGLEATRLIRADGRFEHLPILAMTANASAIDRENCLRAGMNDHIGKPVDMSELVPRILTLTRDEYSISGNNSLANSHSADNNPANNNSANISAEQDRLATESISTERVMPQDVAILEDTSSILRRFGGEMSFFIDVKQSFVSEMMLQLGLLTTAFEQADLQTASIVAHTIKGTASNLGAKRLAAFGAQLELECKQGLEPLAAKQWLLTIEQSITDSALHLDKLFLSTTSDEQVEEKKRPLINGEHNDQFDRKMLKELILLLEEQNLDAFDKLSHILENLVSEGHWLTLETQVNNLQFNDALVTAEAILKGAETC